MKAMLVRRFVRCEDDGIITGRVKHTYLLARMDVDASPTYDYW